MQVLIAACPQGVERVNRYKSATGGDYTRRILKLNGKTVSARTFFAALAAAKQEKDA